MSRSKALWQALSTPYEPAHLPSWVGPMLSALLSVLCLNRGVDLLRQRMLASPVGDVVDYYGTTTFGVLFVVAGATVLASLIARRAVPLLVGHVGMAGIYVWYAASLLLGVLGNHGIGIRFVASALGGAAVSIVLAFLLARQVGRQIRAGI